MDRSLAAGSPELRQRLSGGLETPSLPLPVSHPPRMSLPHRLPVASWLSCGSHSSTHRVHVQGKKKGGGGGSPRLLPSGKEKASRTRRSRPRPLSPARTGSPGPRTRRAAGRGDEDPHRCRKPTRFAARGRARQRNPRSVQPEEGGQILGGNEGWSPKADAAHGGEVLGATQDPRNRARAPRGGGEGSPGLPRETEPAGCANVGESCFTWSAHTTVETSKFKICSGGQQAGDPGEVTARAQRPSAVRTPSCLGDISLCPGQAFH